MTQPSLASVMSSWIYKSLVVGDDVPARLQMHPADTDDVLPILYLDMTTLACHFPAVSDPSMQTRIVSAARTLRQLVHSSANGWKTEITTSVGGSPRVIVELAVNRTDLEQDSKTVESQLADLKTDLALGDVVFVLALNDVSEPAELSKLFKCCLGSMAHFAVKLMTTDQSGQLEWSLNDGPPSIIARS